MIVFLSAEGLVDLDRGDLRLSRDCTVAQDQKKAQRPGKKEKEIRFQCTHDHLPLGYV